MKCTLNSMALALSLLFLTGCGETAPIAEDDTPSSTAVETPVIEQPLQQDQRQPWTAQEIRLIDRPDEIVAVLENGMTAIVKEIHTAPVAAVRLYVRAGSIYEQEHLGAGLSHLFEHLLAGGSTKKRSEEQSRHIIQQIGAQHNAFTSKAMTCYYLTVPTEHIGTATDLIADWVTRPTFPDEQFEREWGVVQRELEMNASDPHRQLYRLFYELRYKVHPARYPIIGHQAIVRQLTREEILAYYHRMYVPDNAVVAVVGDINAAEMLDEIKEKFADFTRRTKVNIVLPTEPDVTAPRELVQVFPAMQGPAKMLMGFPSFKLQHPDLYALDTLANILGKGRSSRLYQALRERQQLVLSIEAYNYTPHWGDGTFTISCELTPENVAAAREAIWEEIERIKAEGVEPNELARAKTQMRVEHIRSLQTAASQAARMAEDYLATGDAHFSDHYVQGVQRVTAEQIQTLARQYLVRQKQLTLVLTPQPLPAAETAETQEKGESPIKKITLDNGLRVLLKRNLAVPLVNMQLYVIGGLFDETESNSGITNLMARLSTRGATSYTNKQIVDYFDGVGGAIAATCGNNTYFYAAEVTSQDFDQAFDIFAEVVIEPSFPQDELAKLKEQILASIKQIKNSWHGQAVQFFRDKFFINSPYRRISMGTLDSVAALTRDQIREFHRAKTVGNRTVLAIFGDIDLEAVEKTVREKFAALPRGAAFDLQRFPPEPTPDAPRQFVQETAKPGATVFIGFPGMQLTNLEDRYPMEVLTEIVGSNRGWLHELLRGRQLVYYAWAFSFPGLTPGYLAATAQCDADKVPEVISLIQQQLAKARTGGFTDDEIAAAKSNRINAEILDKQTNADAAMTAALDELYGFGYDWSEGHADRIMAVTRQNVQHVAEKYLSPPPTITIVSSRPESVPDVAISPTTDPE